MDNYYLEFFNDRNVGFPEKPKLIDNIRIYKSPHGLGIQFRGGPHKFIIKGHNSYSVFNYLEPLLNGTYTLSEILHRAPNNIEKRNIFDVLRILHANNIFENDSSKGCVDAVLPDSQLKYYSRILGKTTFNKSVDEIIEILSNTKALVIGSGLFAATLINVLNKSGVNNLGLYIQNDIYVDDELSFLLKKKIDNLTERQVLDALSEDLLDFKYIIVALDNPTDSFLKSINRMGLTFNIPTLFALKRDNKFNLGPYVIPKMTSCYNCYTLRNNSFSDDSIFDNIYQDYLTEQGVSVDDSIKGDDFISCLVACGIITSEFTKISTGYAKSTLVDQVLEYDFLNGSIFNYQTIFRVPRCPECYK